METDDYYKPLNLDQMAERLRNAAKAADRVERLRKLLEELLKVW